MVRMAYIKGLASTSLSFFVEATNTAIWSTVEPGLGIIAGSLATLRPLFRSFLRTVRTFAESGMDTRNPQDTVKSVHARSAAVVNEMNDESMFMGQIHERAQSSQRRSRAEIDKEMLSSGGDGRRQLTPQPSVIVHHVDSEGIEMEQTRTSEDTNHMEVPVMKRVSADIHNLHIVGGLPRTASSTAGSESPMIGYAR
jgi:hypothetical protein